MVGNVYRCGSLDTSMYIILCTTFSTFCTIYTQQVNSAGIILLVVIREIYYYLQIDQDVISKLFLFSVSTNLIF
jgi:hypothetical protein